MPTLSFIRPTDPIEAVGMATTISNAIGKTVTCEITASDLLVTGSTISGADSTNIQNAVNTYFYPNTQIGIPVVDNPDMSGNRHDKSVTEHAAYMADTAVAAIANSKMGNNMLDTDGTLTANSDTVITSQKAVKTYIDSKAKMWVSGVQKSKWIFYVSSATTSSGNITVYITDNGTAGGNAVFTNIYEDSIFFTSPNSSVIYTYSNVTVSGDKKSVTASVSQVNSVLLGLLSFVTASNGTNVQLTVIGD